MHVTVIGAGNGGMASAFDFAQHGHDVALFAPPHYGDNVVAVAEAGGITASGDLEGFAPIRYAGHDPAEAMAGADLGVVGGPAHAPQPPAPPSSSGWAPPTPPSPWPPPRGPTSPTGRPCWSARARAPARSRSSAPPGL